MDINKVYSLLAIVEKAAEAGVAMKPLRDMAIYLLGKEAKEVEAEYNELRAREAEEAARQYAPVEEPHPDEAAKEPA